MLLCRAAVDLSRSTLNYLAGLIRRHRNAIGSAWRLLNPGQQALLVLVHLRKGETFAEVGAGFGVSTSTAWRYVEEAVALLSERSPKLTAALRRAAKGGLHLVVLDGTLIACDRVRADRPYYSAKHRCHGMNIQVIAGPDRTIVWTSGALPGRTHDLTAARVWGILRELDKAGILTLADKGYQGAEASVVITPYKGRNKPESQKQANRSHAKLRGPGERANAQLKSWTLLRKLRCSPCKAGHLVKAIAVLQNYQVTRGLVSIDRVAADRPYYSGKHRRHGVNLRVIAAPDGTQLWVSGPLRGSVYDLAAARIWGVIRALATTGLLVLADKAYQGAGAHILTPYKGRDKPEPQKDANRAHAKLRGPGERANAQLKSWRIPRKPRCRPTAPAASPKPSTPCNSARPHPGERTSLYVLE